MTIEMFQVIDISGEATGGLYKTLHEARAYASEDQAVEMLTFEYSDRELVWTPDGSDTWPPEPSEEEEDKD